MLTEFDLHSFGQTHVGSVRKINEDALLELPEHQLWLVADGMGGHAAGDVASKIIVDTVKECIRRQAGRGLNVALLKQAVLIANEKIMEYSKTHLGGHTAGSTLVLLWIEGATAHWLWAGDSRGYRYLQGRFVQVTRDHSHVNELIDEGVLSAEESESHPMGNVITRAIGVVDEIEIDHVSHPIGEGELLLLCTDGLTGELSNREIAQHLNQSNIIDMGLSLLHDALINGAKDNVTLILVSVSNRNDLAVADDDDLTVPLFQ